ncbi:MAG: CBS domain-containing protein [Chloroflexi bacterium]|nr:MAG: CBS domain-containing protein [Chloroflexota bacterium]
MNIKSILATKGAHVVTIGPDQQVRDALKVLAEHNYGALVIADTQNHPIGIISERDIVRLAAKNENCFSVPVGEVMTKNLILGVPQDDLRAVANTMTDRRIRHLPIVDDQGVLMGIVSIGDVVKAERNNLEGEADTLRRQILATAV